MAFLGYGAGQTFVIRLFHRKNIKQKMFTFVFIIILMKTYTKTQFTKRLNTDKKSENAENERQS